MQWIILSLPHIFISGFNQLTPGIEILGFLKGCIPLVNRSWLLSHAFVWCVCRSPGSIENINIIGAFWKGDYPRRFSHYVYMKPLVDAFVSRAFAIWNSFAGSSLHLENWNEILRFTASFKFHTNIISVFLDTNPERFENPK